MKKLQLSPKKDFYVYEVLATKPKSIQAIKYKVVMKKGETYVLKTLVDREYKNDDPFIEKVYTSFKVNDSVPSRTLFENKLHFSKKIYSVSMIVFEILLLNHLII